MKVSTKHLLLMLMMFVLSAGERLMAQVLDPNDPVVEYDSTAPPQLPAGGALGKWVKTDRVGYNTSQYKCYIYKGVAFRLLYPKSYVPGVSDGKVYPLYLFWHGIGEAGTIYDNELQLAHGGDVHMNAVNNGSFDGFLLYPQSSSGTGFFGNGQYDAMHDLIVNYLIPQCKVDPYHIIVDGLSGGGTAAWGFSMRYPKMVSCLTPISSASQDFNAGIPNLEFTPIWYHQGGLDTGPTPATASVVVNAYNNAGAQFRYTLYTTLGHGCWDSAWAEPDYYPYMLRAHQTNPWTLTGRNQFCPGDAINVTIGVKPGFDAYEWKKDGQLIAGATSNTITATAPGVYSCHFKDGATWSPWSIRPDTISIKAPTVSPAIALATLESDVIPASDGSTSVALQVPANYATYTWTKVGSSTVLSTTNKLSATSAGSYQVQVTEQFGCSSSPSAPFAVVDANGASKPSPVTGVTASTDSKTSLRLNWNNNPAPQFPSTGIEIYQATASGGPYKFIALVSKDSMTYLATGLNANTTYYYEIRTVNSTSASTVSTPVSATTAADNEAPTSPGNLSITSTTRNSASLAWTASTDNVGVTEYDVYVNGVKSYITTSTTFTVYNLNYGQFYNFTVKAKDFAGNSSPFSNQATTQAVTQGLNFKYYTFAGTWNTLADFGTLTPVSTGVVPNVTIAGATQADNFAYLWTGYIKIPVDGSYTFHTASDDGSKLWLGNAGQSASPYTFSGTPLVNNDGLHGTNDASGTRTLTAGTYPIAIAFYQQGGGAVMNISWLTPQTGGNVVTIPDSVFADPATVTNLQIPAAPTNLAATATSSKNINLSWTDNSNNETKFEIWRSTDSITFQTIGTAAANVTTYSDSTLAGGTTYYYRVKAVSNQGESAFALGNHVVNYSYYISSTGLSVLPDFSKLTPTSTGTDTAFTLGMQTQNDNWETKYTGYINIPVTGSYTFYTSSDDGSKLYIDAFDEAHRVVNNDGLHGTQEASGTVTLVAGFHPIYVTFFQAGGGAVLTASYQGPGIPKQLIPPSVLGQPLTASATTVPLPAVPTAPSGLTASGVSPSKVLVTWTDNSSNETRFELYRSSTTNANYVLLATLAPNTVSFTDSALFANSIYYYKVRGVNAGGNSAFSAEDSALTGDHAPVLAPITAQQYMRYDAQLSLPVSATDVDQETLTITVNNLPSFATFTPSGNGTGVITFTPSQALQGTYPGIMVVVTDQHGGTTSSSFTLVVNNNYPPAITHVAGGSNITVNEKQTAQLTLTATDQNTTDVLTWTFTGLPAFATPVITGGTAQINLAPGYADNGVYNVKARVDDGNNGFDTLSFVITVINVNPSRTVFVNFSDGTIAAAAPWNNTAKTPALNDNFAALKDSTGAVSTVGVKLLTLWTGVNTQGANTGNNSGVYPDAVLRTSYYTSTVQTVRIYGLDVKSKYNFTMTGSRANPAAGVGVVTSYTIGGVAQTLNAANNSTAVVSFNGITPAADSSVTLTVQKATGSTYGYLNALVIQSVFDDSTAPAKPRGLAATVANGTVVLNWTDAAYNETGYEVYRSTSQSGPYTQLLTAVNDANLQAYTDSTVHGNTDYYYSVRAVNQYGATYSDTVLVTTPNVAPVLATISNVNLKTDSVLDLSLTATDDSANVITLTASGLPAFATFTDNGNGTGVIHLAPGSATGTFTISVTATDNFGAATTKQFTVTVTDKNLTFVYVNFNQTLPASAPWNNTNSAPSAGVKIANLADANGNSTGIGLSLSETWSAANNIGVVTGNNSGIYPDNVMQTFYYDGATTAKHVVLSGLSSARRYNLVFFASRANYTSSLITTYTVGSQTVQLDANNNSTNTVQVNGIAPDASGNITISVLKAGSSPNAYLGAMVIQSYAYNGAPVAPGSLTAAGTSKTQIQLNWVKTSDSVSDYEVWRSSTYGGTYTKVGDAGTANSYVDSNLVQGATWFYEVRSVTNGTFSPYSNIAGASTVQFTINLNLNDGSAGPAQPAPWNNTNTLIANGFLLNNMIDDQSLNTGVNFGVVRTFSGFNTVGAVTGNNSGIVPDNVSKSLYYNNYGDSSILTISGLDQAYVYNLAFFGSRANPTVGVTSTYRVGNQTVQLDATNNTSNLARINGIHPDSTGTITFSVTAAIKGGFGYLNALFVDGVPLADTTATDTTVNDTSTKAPLDTATPASLRQDSSAAILASAKVYPNPFTDDVTLRLDLTENVDKFVVQVVDMGGRIIVRREFYNALAGIWQQNIGLDGARLPRGIYLIQVVGLKNDRPRVFTVIKK
ncbi:MAG TPA: fibronectin type III domain-containing protein [Puia sp.]|nr:fibronectin type III domain-containing protein [Puia sp.]